MALPLTSKENLVTFSTPLIQNLCFAVSTVVISQPSVAQVFDMGSLTATLSVDHVTQSERARARAQGLTDYRATTPAGAAVSAMSSALSGKMQSGISSEPLIYRSTSDTRQQALVAYISRINQHDAKSARLVDEQFRKHDFGRIYHGIVAPFGLRDDDVADTLAGYTILGWLIASGSPDPSREGVRAFRNQLASRLMQNSQFNDAQVRTELGEELKLLFVTLHAGWQSARREGKLQQYSDGVAAMFQKQTGNDLRQLVLTDRGLEKRG